jgi:hypothetical protein
MNFQFGTKELMLTPRDDYRLRHGGGVDLSAQR